MSRKLNTATPYIRHDRNEVPDGLEISCTSWLKLHLLQHREWFESKSLVNNQARFVPEFNVNSISYFGFVLFKNKRKIRPLTVNQIPVPLQEVP